MAERNSPGSRRTAAKQGAKSPSRRTPRKPRSFVVTCAERLSIEDVSTLRDQLQEALNAGRPVSIDASRVERADTASLQLLCAFFRTAHERQVHARWQSPASALRDAAARLGLTESLALNSSEK